MVLQINDVGGAVGKARDPRRMGAIIKQVLSTQLALGLVCRSRSRYLILAVRAAAAASNYSTYNRSSHFYSSSNSSRRKRRSSSICSSSKERRCSSSSIGQRERFW